MPDIANTTIILNESDFDNAQQLVLTQMQNASISHNKVPLQKHTIPELLLSKIK